MFCGMSTPYVSCMILPIAPDGRDVGLAGRAAGDEREHERHQHRERAVVDAGCRSSASAMTTMPTAGDGRPRRRTSRWAPRRSRARASSLAARRAAPRETGEGARDGAPLRART